MTSLATLKTSPTKKLEKDPSKNNMKKDTEKTIENKPVLAMEREARLKEERDPNESQNVSCTSSGLRPRLLENSQKKPPRAKTRKHHRKNAKTLQKLAQNDPKMTPKSSQNAGMVCKNEGSPFS